METIQVGYDPIESTGNMAHHKYIVYTNNAGERFRIDGGGTQQPDGSAADDYLGNLLGLGKLGSLYVKTTYIEQGSNLADIMVGQPIETIHQGNDLSSLFAKMERTGEDITSREGTYHMFANNSNGVVDEILERNGLPETTLHEEHWSPGGGVDKFVDWRATESTLREMYGDNPEIYKDILLELAMAKSLGGAYADEFVNKYGNLVSYYYNCFPAGTPIDMWDGSRKDIKDIRPLDEVLTRGEDGNPAKGIVDKTFTNTASELIHLSFDDGRDDLYTTPGHHFLSETGEYVQIGQMVKLSGALQESERA